jgi:hypothetical protein
VSVTRNGVEGDGIFFPISTDTIRNTFVVAKQVCVGTRATEHRWRVTNVPWLLTRLYSTLGLPCPHRRPRGAKTIPVVWYGPRRVPAIALVRRRVRNIYLCYGQPFITVPVDVFARVGVTANARKTIKHVIFMVPTTFFFLSFFRREARRKNSMRISFNDVLPSAVWRNVFKMSRTEVDSAAKLYGFETASCSDTNCSRTIWNSISGRIGRVVIFVYVASGVVHNRTILYLNPTYFRQIKPLNTAQIYISITYTFI